MATLQIKIDGVNKTVERLASIGSRGLDFTPVLLKAKADLLLANASNFTTNGLLVGGWKPLDASYASWKSTRFPGAPTMVQTGKLFNSLTSQNAAFSTMTNTSLTLGTNVEYAKFHQYGTTKMPKRKIVFEPAGFTKKVNENAVSWMANGDIV